MFYRLRRDLSSRWFDHAVRSVLRTPPVVLDPSSPTMIVSQLWRRDLYMYLIAIKSFTRYLRPSRVCVVGDRLEEAHHSLLSDHVQGIEIVSVAEVDTTGFPRGGTWERLLHIIDLSADRYVIQLDADTISLDSPQEVLDCVRQNRSFTLGTGMARGPLSLAQTSELVAEAARTNRHVQVMAEHAAARIPDQSLKYVRGNSAFAGFGRGNHSRAQVRYFSDQMRSLLGESKWNEWGSEQVTSNFTVANAPDPFVLPFPKYRYYQPGAELAGSAFMHFMGTYRFANGVYRRMALQTIDAFLAAPHAEGVRAVESGHS